MAGDLESTVFPIEDATPQVVAQKLRVFTYPVGQSVPWPITLGRLQDKAGGEVRKAADWRDLPEGESVLVVAGEADGEYVVRWATSSGLDAAIGGMIHDCFLGPGDRFTDLRKGFAVLTQDGRVRFFD
jgi:hypothetical protein